MFSLISRNIARASPFTSRTLTVSVSKFHTSTCLFKDKNDNRSSGLAAPRKTVAKPETPKKEKTEDDKEKRKREQMEREVCRTHIGCMLRFSLGLTEYISV